MIHANRAKQGAKLICLCMQTYGSDGKGGMASGSPRQAWLLYKDSRRSFTDLWASSVCQLFVNQVSVQIEMLDTYLNAIDIYNSVETILQKTNI